MQKTFKRALFLFAMSAEVVFGAPETWKGGVAPAPTSMAQATNWNSGVAPVAGDTFIFPGPPSVSGVGSFTVLDDLAAGPFVIGNSIQINSTTSYTINVTAGNSFVMPAGTNTFTSTGAHTFAIPLALNAAGKLQVTSSSSALTLTGAISGSGVGLGLELAAGQLILGTTNTYLGGTTIDSNLSTPAVLTVLTNGALSSGPAATVTDNGSLVFQLTGTETYGAGAISGSGTVTISSGTLIIPAGLTNTYAGITTIGPGATLAISNNTNIGPAAVSIGDGTLQLNTGFTFSHPITLTAQGTVNTQNNVDSISSVISESPTSSGVGSLNVVAGTGSLELQTTSINTYGGGTTITSGKLIIHQQNNLSTGTLTMGAATPGTTLSIMNPISNLSNAINLQGISTINTNGNNVTLTKPISGSGPLTIITGAGTMFFSSKNGAYSYSGGTTVGTGLLGDTSTLQGDTSSLQGNITIATGATLIFDQKFSTGTAFNGTYSGSLSGAGSLTKNSPGTVTLSGDSFNNAMPFTGATTINGGTLNVTGSIQGSAVTVNSGGTLTGSGTDNTGSGGILTGAVGSVTVNSGGAIGPNGIGTLTANGPVTFSASATPEFNVNITPTSTDLLKVVGVATLTGAPVQIQPESGFYGSGATYTILHSTNPIATVFGPVTSTDPNLIPILSYGPNDVFLTINVLVPFLGFTASNENTQAVANYINRITEAGLLPTDPLLVKAINSFQGQSNAVINNALDQLHPAPFSAFSELQAEVGGQIVNLFHRRPEPRCCCEPWRVWVTPYGNWLEERHVSFQLGFEADTGGIAAGADWIIKDNLVVGIGGVANHSNLHWHHHRGHSSINTYYGAAYVDFTKDFVYMGGVAMIGWDKYHSYRKIDFTTIHETAFSKHDAFDLIIQGSTGFFFGPQACCFYPYINIDYMLLDQRGFKESGAAGLALQVEPIFTETLRGELGLSFKVQDTNYPETMCIAPKLGIGYAVNHPITRKRMGSRFIGIPFGFHVEGWDYTWQLMTFNFGLDLSYKCFTLGGDYYFEFSSSNRLRDQRANIRFSLNW